MQTLFVLPDNLIGEDQAILYSAALPSASVSLPEPHVPPAVLNYYADLLLTFAPF